jgi:broad specificity phosphatase PhoE
MGKILLVRHGQASFNDDDYDRLSPLGVEQARHLGEWFTRCGLRIDRAVTGGMRRHRQTADACLGAVGFDAPADSDPGLDEYDFREVILRLHPEFADAQALTRHVAAAEHPRRTFQALFAQALQRWIGGHDAGYRETWVDFRARCVAALERVAAAAGRSTNAVVFTSGGPIAAVCQHLLGLADERVGELNFAIVNCSVTALKHRPGQVSLDYFNNYAHLEHAGDGRLVTYR